MRIGTLILSLIFLSLGSCTEKAVNCSDVPDFPDTLQVTIRNGETRTIYQCDDTEVKLTFSSVNDDSRCPTGVNCVWAGTAHITINFNNAPDNIVLELTKEKDLQYLDKTYSVLFEALNPYPENNTPTNPANYIATLKFTKK